MVWFPTATAAVVLVAFAAVAAGTGCVQPGTAHPEVFVLHSVGSRTQVPRTGPVAEGMEAWEVGPGVPGVRAKLTDLPSRMVAEGVGAYIPNQAVPLPEGTALKLKCPDTCGGAACEFFIAVYHCPPCSTATSGGLPSILPGEGWRGAGCAPRFTTPGSESKHRMVMFKHVVHADQHYITPPLGPLRNVVVFAKAAVTECDVRWKRDPCNAVAGCRWSSGECASAWCPAPVGPVAGGGGVTAGGAASRCSQCAPAAALAAATPLR